MKKVSVLLIVMAMVAGGCMTTPDGVRMDPDMLNAIVANAVTYGPELVALAERALAIYEDYETRQRDLDKEERAEREAELNEIWEQIIAGISTVSQWTMVLSSGTATSSSPVVITSPSGTLPIDSGIR